MRTVKALSAIKAQGPLTIDDTTDIVSSVIHTNDPNYLILALKAAGGACKVRILDRPVPAATARLVQSTDVTFSDNWAYVVLDPSNGPLQPQVFVEIDSDTDGTTIILEALWASVVV